MHKINHFISVLAMVLLAGTPSAQTPAPVSDTVAVYRDLDFAAVPSGTLKLDLYVPTSAAGPVPGMVVIPGGGFRPQSREKFAAEARILADAGFASASIGYRGAPDDTFEATVADTKAAVRYLRANAAQFNIDPDYIGAFGQSAGGHLAVMLAVSGGDEELDGDGGNPDVSSRVQAAVSFAGVFDFVSRLRDGGQQAENLDQKRRTNGAWVGEPFSEDSLRWKQASPYYRVTSDDPPVLFVHCKDDATVPYQQSVDMAERMKVFRPQSRLLLFERGGHGIRNSREGDVKARAWAETIAFLRKTLVPPAQREAGPARTPPTYSDIQYGPHARNLMDVWVVESSTPAPVLLSIHGGGFRRGEKGINSRLLRECLASGIAVVALTYRFTDEAIAPAQFHDAARAVQFVRHNAAAWNMDPSRMAATGGSAGAGLSLWLGFHEDMADPDNEDPVLRHSTRLTCMAVSNGQTSYDPRFIRELFPESDTYKTTPLELLFGIDVDALDSLPEEKYRLFEEVSALPHLTADDVPVLLAYRSARDTPILNRSIGIHHPRFGDALKAKMDPLGIECQVHAGLDGKGEEQAAVMMAFIRRHLGVPTPVEE